VAKEPKKKEGLSGVRDPCLVRFLKAKHSKERKKRENLTQGNKRWEKGDRGSGWEREIKNRRQKPRRLAQALVTQKRPEKIGGTSDRA